MNLQQIKTRLDEISRSTATVHHKVLISQLCAVIGDVIKIIESPPLVEFKKSKARIPATVETKYDLNPMPKTVPERLPLRKRTGNAGDAK